jgi:hypothetical protein
MESVSYLPDPKNDRHVKSVPPPPNKPLSSSVLFSNKKYPSKSLNFFKLFTTPKI